MAYKVTLSIPDEDYETLKEEALRQGNNDPYQPAVAITTLVEDAVTAKATFIRMRNYWGAQE